MAAEMKVNALAPWYGSNRTLAEHVGRELRGCQWVGIPFAGSMAEVPHITSRTLVVNDLHENVINLARVVADAEQRRELIERLSLRAFHPRELAEAQARCIDRLNAEGLFGCEHAMDPVSIAEDYFVAVWMGRSGRAGTSTEFRGGLPVRWNANGGDSNTRYRSAVESLEAWGHILTRCNFTCADCFEFIGSVNDAVGVGVYSDSPFPDVGYEYRHSFTETHHRRWAGELAKFSRARVVCRFYDHPLVRELYPEPRWTWRFLEGGRDQANQGKPEVLIINGPSYANN